MIKGQSLKTDGRWRIELVRTVYVVYYDNVVHFCTLEWREALKEFDRLNV
jgi:hypothetical protein